MKVRGWKKYIYNDEFGGMDPFRSYGEVEHKPK